MDADGHEHEDDHAAQALREAFRGRASAYEVVPTPLPARPRRWALPAAVAAGAAAVALAVTWVVDPSTPTPPAAAPTPSEGAQPGGQPPFLVDEDGGPMLGCSGSEPAFSRSAMDGELNDELPRADVLNALVTLPTSLRAETLEEVDYRVLARWTEDEAESLLIGIGPWSSSNDDPLADLEAWRVVRTEQGWDAQGGGTCIPAAVGVAGTALATVLPPETDSVSTGVRVTVAVSEMACASGRDPRPFLRDPYFVEADAAITVFWPMEMSPGGTCVGTMPVETELELPSPLGDRVLLDGSVWPPQQVLP